jgi:hypothetical protein
MALAVVWGTMHAALQKKKRTGQDACDSAALFLLSTQVFSLVTPTPSYFPLSQTTMGDDSSGDKEEEEK